MCSFEVTPLCEGRGTIGAMKRLSPWMSEHMPFENMCPCGGIFPMFATIRHFSRVDSHVNSASLIARVVELWTNKLFLWAINSHVGFQIGKFGTRVATLIAFVIFLYIRLDLVDFGHLEKFWKSWKVNVMTAMSMMMMMMMMMAGIFTYGRNTYRYSFRRYSVRTPSQWSTWSTWSSWSSWSPWSTWSSWVSWSSEQTGQAGHIGQTKLMFELDFPGNLWRPAFAILMMFYLHVTIWF